MVQVTYLLRNACLAFCFFDKRPTFLFAILKYILCHFIIPPKSALASGAFTVVSLWIDYRVLWGNPGIFRWLCMVLGGKIDICITLFHICTMLHVIKGNNVKVNSSLCSWSSKQGKKNLLMTFTTKIDKPEKNRHKHSCNCQINAPEYNYWSKEETHALKLYL